MGLGRGEAEEEVRLEEGLNVGLESERERKEGFQLQGGDGCGPRADLF